MTSENPFETGVSVIDVPTDPEIVDPSDETVESPKPNVRRSRSAKSTPMQLQPPADDLSVDDESTGENDPETNTESVGDTVEAELVDEDSDSEDEDSDSEETEPGTDLAEWTAPPFPSIEANWPHDVIEYGGFNLGVRIPTSQALTGFTMATGAYVPDIIKQAMVSKFVQLHFSPQSHAFLMIRLMTPDADFDEETFGDLVRILVEKGGEKVIAEAEAKAAAQKKLGKKKGKRGQLR